MFVWKNGELNPEQESAIFNENSVLLIACPGSGKTRTLTYKIAYELSSDTLLLRQVPIQGRASSRVFHL